MRKDVIDSVLGLPWLDYALDPDRHAFCCGRSVLYAMPSMHLDFDGQLCECRLCGRTFLVRYLDGEVAKVEELTASAPEAPADDPSGIRQPGSQ